MEPLHEKGIFDTYLKLFMTSITLEQPENFEVLVLGFKYNDFIMTTQPENIKITFNFSAGTEYKSNYLFDGKSYEFQTKILKLQDNPIPLIFFSYPKNFKETSLRKNERLQVLIPLAIKTIRFRDGANKEINNPKNKIIDISKNGCLISTFRKIELGSILTLDFFLPDGTPVKDLEACVRNSLRTPMGMHIGLEFFEMDEENKKKFDDFFSNIK